MRIAALCRAIHICSAAQILAPLCWAPDAKLMINGQASPKPVLTILERAKAWPAPTACLTRQMRDGNMIYLPR